MWYIPYFLSLSISSVQFSCSVVFNSLQPHGLQHVRPPCPSPTPRVYSNSCPLSQWCHPTVSYSVIPSLAAFNHSQHQGLFQWVRSFPVSRLFTSGDQIIGTSASASVFPMNIQDWYPSGWTDWISLQSKGLWRVFSSSLPIGWILNAEWYFAAQRARTSVVTDFFPQGEKDFALFILAICSFFALFFIWLLTVLHCRFGSCLRVECWIQSTL